MCEWLAAIFAGKSSLAELSADEFAAALTARLPYPLQRRLDAEAPSHFAAPTGSHVPIDYEAEGGPKIAIRVQELFGLDRHPAIAGGRIPLVVELLVPGAPAGPDDARPAGLLARQLRRRARGNARPLSETSVAGQSARRHTNPTRQKKRRVAKRPQARNKMKCGTPGRYSLFPYAPSAPRPQCFPNQSRT